MARWNLSIRDETDRDVRAFLGRNGYKKGDLAKFVEDAVRRDMLRRDLDALREANSDLTAEEAQALADEAVAWARANPA